MSPFFSRWYRWTNSNAYCFSMRPEIQMFGWRVAQIVCSFCCAFLHVSKIGWVHPWTLFEMICLHAARRSSICSWRQWATKTLPSRVSIGAPRQMPADHHLDAVASSTAAWRRAHGRLASTDLCLCTMLLAFPCHGPSSRHAAFQHSRPVFISVVCAVI